MTEGQQCLDFAFVHCAVLEVEPDPIVLKVCGVVIVEWEKVPQTANASKFSTTESGQNCTFSHYEILTGSSKAEDATPSVKSNYLVTNLAYRFFYMILPSSLQ